MSSTRVYMIRHGVTASNLAGRYMSRSQETLSNDGRWQARQLALRLASFELAAIYASPLRRTKETAEIIAQPHALAVTVEPDFNELDLHRWEGLTAAEIEDRDPKAWELWCAEPARLRLDGIETFEDVRQRVRRGLQNVVRRHPEDATAVVTHDGIVRIAVLEALGIGLGHYRSIPVDNTGLTVLEIKPERSYLRSLNDTGHLTEALGVRVAGPGDR